MREEGETMIKTVAEWNAECDDKICAVLETRRDRQKLREIYVLEIVKQGIQVYENTATNSHGRQIDRTNYEEFREHLRKFILQGDGGVGFIDLICDGCGTHLFDSNPSTLMSNPPKFHADCCGCGRRYALVLSARVHCATEPSLGRKA